MQFGIGVVLMVVLAWVIYAVLSFLGVGNAGNVAAYSALALVVGAGIYFWLKDEAVASNVKICPSCQFEIPSQAAVCGHCQHRFSDEAGNPDS